ncbi:hypothetical protein AOLI_G00113190 [Acnodon oligacanthus]
MLNACLLRSPKEMKEQNLCFRMMSLAPISSTAPPHNHPFSAFHPSQQCLLYTARINPTGRGDEHFKSGKEDMEGRETVTLA